MDNDYIQLILLILAGSAYFIGVIVGDVMIYIICIVIVVLLCIAAFFGDV